MKRSSLTTRANSRRISRNKKLQRIAFAGAGVVLVLIILPSLFSFVASVVFSPINAVKTYLVESTGSLPAYFRQRTELINEIDTLRQQLTDKNASRYTANQLSRENEELRALLHAQEELRVLAGVIGRPSVLPYDALLLDRGTAHGVYDNAPVFIGDNAVIGFVAKAYAHSAVVKLVTTPGLTSSVYIIGPNIYTNAEGIGGGQMRVGVPQGINLQEGDLVVLPSFSSAVYGTVSVVESVATQPQQYGYVSPEIPIASLRLVSVGQPRTEAITFEEAQTVVQEARDDLFMVPVPDEILVTPESATTSDQSATSSVEGATTSNNTSL